MMKNNTETETEQPSFDKGIPFFYSGSNQPGHPKNQPAPYQWIKLAAFFAPLHIYSFALCLFGS